jgi:hypothetical protein
MSLFEAFQRKQNKASDSYAAAKQQESQSRLDGPYYLTRNSITSSFTQTNHWQD